MLGATALATSQQSQPEWKKNMIEGDRYSYARMFRHALSCYEKAYADPAIKDSADIQLRLLKNLIECYDIVGDGKQLVQANIRLHDLAKAKGQDAYVAMSDFMKGKHMHYQGSKDKGYALCLKSLELLKKSHCPQKEKELALFYGALARMYTRDGLYADALQMSELGEEVARQIQSSEQDRLDRALARVLELEKQVEGLSMDAEQLQREIAHLKMQKDILVKCAEVLKKDGGANLKSLSNKEKTLVIDALRPQYKLKDLLKALSLAKSSYCYQRVVMAKPDKYAQLKKDIQTIFAENFQRYGYRRICCCLKKNRIRVAEKVVRRLMRLEGLRVYTPRKRKYSSYVGEVSPSVPNLLQRDFHAELPNQKWLTDITEFSIPAGKVYLSPIIDCFDGMPVSWRIGCSPSAQMANVMLKDAIASLKPAEHPIIHSDRGGHYRWPEWIKITSDAGLTRSMSKKGCSPDNSACEGFFGRLKNEMFYGKSWEGFSLAQFMASLDSYMQWYKEKRIKVSLGGLSPLEYREALGLT